MKSKKKQNYYQNSGGLGEQRSDWLERGMNELSEVKCSIPYLEW